MMMTQNDIEYAYDIEMTQDELMKYYKPDNVPRSPTTSEVNAIMESGLNPIDYIMTWFYDKGGEGWENWVEMEGEYDDIIIGDDEVIDTNDDDET